MIRGLQKQIIQLTTPKSPYFEVVLFVLRPELVQLREHEGDMVREAQKILSESAPRAATVKELVHGEKKQRLALFLVGALCGGILCGAGIAFLTLLF